MSATYLLSRRAAADLDEIFTYYESEADVRVCERIMQEFERTFRMLAESPHIGHHRTDLTNESVRFWTVYSYFVIYDARSSPMTVVRVLHAQRDIASLELD